MRFPALAVLPLALLVSGCTETSSLRSGDLAVNQNVISVTPANLAKKPIRTSIQIPRFPSGPLTVETDTIAGITFQGVSFDARDYRLAVIDQPGGPGSKYPDARSAAASRDGLAAVNAGFFTPEGAPLGRVISGGKAAGSWNRSSLGSGVFTESPSGHLAISRRAAVPSDTSSRELLQAGPLLVENGRSVSGLNGGKPAVRTLMLWDGDNRWWVGKSSVCTLAKLGAALGDGSPTDWKIHTALNLDGGRSTDLWVSASVSGGPASFRPLWNRPVRNFLVIVPRPPLTVTFPLQNQ